MLEPRYRTGVAVLLAAGLAGCDSAPDALAPDPIDDAAPVASALSPNAANAARVPAWLAGVRAATAAFHRLEDAEAAGYDTPITACMELAGTGGQGIHYGDIGLIDGVVEAYRPEILLYEPQKNGRPRLVAVEYIVPFAAWTAPDPPAIHGQAFHANTQFQVWALHAWIWLDNATGIFADWNPAVTCAHAN